MKHEIYAENTRFIFTDLDHLKLISEWCKNFEQNFIVTFDTRCLIYVCESHENGKQKKCSSLQIFGNDILSAKTIV